MKENTPPVLERVGLISKILMVLCGCWCPIARKEKKTKRKEKLATNSRLKEFAREFQGRLMLEPLEERIVP